jgi:hypothetical protein
MNTIYIFFPSKWIKFIFGTKSFIIQINDAIHTNTNIYKIFYIVMVVPKKKKKKNQYQIQMCTFYVYT